MVVKNDVTTIYMVRHADSPYIPGAERTKGLSAKGTDDSMRVRDLLLGEHADILVSSSYERAIATIRPLAQQLRKEIVLYEDLRERTLAGEPVAAEDFMSAKRKLYEDFRYRFPGGESSEEAQQRAIRVVLSLIREQEGKRIVIGTHGDIMTLMLNYFDARFDYDFWKSTTMPDIYKLTISEGTLSSSERLWRPAKGI